MGERACYLVYCEECDAPASIADDRCPDCSAPLDEN
jgi:predicted amidophosphoribosyltransferase